MDFVTLMICCAVVEACLAAALLSSGQTADRAGWRSWAVSLVMRSAAFLLYVMPVFWRDWAYQTQSQFMAVMLILCSSAVTMYGTAEFLKLAAPKWRDLLPLVLISLAYMLAFTVFESARWRIVLVSTGLAYGLAWACWRIIRHAIGFRRARGFVIFALGLWVFVLLARAGNVLQLPADATSTAISLASMQPWFFVGYLIAVVGTVVGLIGLRDSEMMVHLEAARSEAMYRADTDLLTGLMSRPAFLAQAETCFSALPVQQNALAALMIDCDHFKSINDRFGHFTGDQALRQMGKVIRDVLPAGAFAGRFGGEEFVVLLPQRQASSAVEAAESTRQAVGNIVFDSGRRNIALSISIGVATLCPTDKSLQDVLKRADDALLQAKSSGRNRVVLAPCEPDGFSASTSLLSA